MKKTIRFTKMHGLGNDYIYVDTQRYPIAQPEQMAKTWSAFHTGIGADGLVLIGQSDKADFSMRIFNADGSEALMCGNATRCIGKYVYENRLTDKTTITLDTLSGIKTIELHVTDKQIESITVEMGQPVLEDKKLCNITGKPGESASLQTAHGTYQGYFVSMGNPHFVIFTDDISAVNLPIEGPALENHTAFPQRANIEFVQPLSDGSLRMRVWERGSGITQACGTGACATAVAAVLTGNTDNKTCIRMDGGDLTVEWDKNKNMVYMTGPATKVFEGEIECE